MFMKKAIFESFDYEESSRADVRSQVDTSQLSIIMSSTFSQWRQKLTD
jgi:hypothetical protein